MNFTRKFLICLLFGLFLSACNSPTLAPTETNVPTREATTVPATSIPTTQPSPVPVPPTHTPEPTSTSTPTLVPPTATLKPTGRPTQAQTKAASMRAPVAVVASQPSNVLKSIQQTNVAVQAFVNQLSSLFHGDVSLCAPMLATYNSLINAPTYDVGAQPSNVQQAYTLYRTAIARFNTQSAILRRCGESGAGTINSNDLGVAFQEVSEAAGLMAQAWSLIQYEPSLSLAGSPLLVAIRQAMYDSDVLWEFRSRVQPYEPTPGYWSFPKEVTSFPCNDYMAIYNRIVNAPTFDATKLSENEQGAYSKYRQAIALMTETGGPVAGRCVAQEGQITDEMIFKLMYGGSTSHELYSQAIQLLTQ